MKNWARWASKAGMYLGFALTALSVILIWWRMSPHYWPLLVVGLVIGCASTPFYYYFKSKDKAADPYGDITIQTLNNLGEQQKDHQSLKKQ